MPKVLLIGMNVKYAQRLGKIFQSVHVQCDVMPSFETAFEKIPADPPALVLVQKPDGTDELHSLHAILKTNAPATPFIVALPEANAGTALEVMRTGAYECISLPFRRFDVLAASKRAALRHGRSLFVEKVVQKKRNYFPYVLLFLMGILVAGLFSKQRDGPPPNTISLGSANLSGLQWEGRNLWVGDWFDSTVTLYRVKKGFFKKSRILETDGLYKMQDGQPILVCNTPDALITLGTDLKLRSHQWAVGLPTLQTGIAPATNPTGLAWDGKNLWSCDGQTNLLYRHGIDLKVLDVVKSLITKPVGLACEGNAMWVLGGNPLSLAKLQISENGVVWQGPYAVPNLVPEGILPSGMAIGHGRIWVVTGGDPRMMSKSLAEITKELPGWTPTAILKKGK